MEGEDWSDLPSEPILTSPPCMLKAKVIEFVTLNLLLGVYWAGPRLGHLVCCGRAFLRLASLTATISMPADMVKIVLVISGVSVVRAALGQVMNFSKLLLLHPPSQDKIRPPQVVFGAGWQWSCLDRVGHFHGQVAYHLGRFRYHEDQSGAGWESWE